MEVQPFDLSVGTIDATKFHVIPKLPFQQKTQGELIGGRVFEVSPKSKVFIYVSFRPESEFEKLVVSVGTDS